MWRLGPYVGMVLRPLALILTAALVVMVALPAAGMALPNLWVYGMAIGIVVLFSRAWTGGAAWWRGQAAGLAAVGFLLYAVTSHYQAGYLGSVKGTGVVAMVVGLAMATPLPNVWQGGGKGKGGKSKGKKGKGSDD